MDAQNRTRMFAQEAACSTAERRLGSSKGVREKFAEPRGWALKWDRFALSEIGERQDKQAPFPAVTSTKSR